MNASTASASANNLANALSTYVVNPIIAIIFACGLLVFVYGVVEYMWMAPSGGEKGGNEGKKHMMWGIIGMFVMLASFAIFRMIVNTVGAYDVLRL